MATLYMNLLWFSGENLLHLSVVTSQALVDMLTTDTIEERSLISVGGDLQYTCNTFFLFFSFMHFYPGTMTTHAESINSDLQRGLDRRLRHTQH